VGTLKLKVEAVPTLKGHKSEHQLMSEAATDVCVVLALGVQTNNNANIMVTLSEKAAKEANITLYKLIYEHIYLKLVSCAFTGHRHPIPCTLSKPPIN